MTFLAHPRTALVSRTARASITRALRVFRVGMWLLLAVILVLMAKNWHELRDRLELIEQTRFSLAADRVACASSLKRTAERVSVLP